MTMYADAEEALMDLDPLDADLVPEPVPGEPGMVWCLRCEGNGTIGVCPPNCQGHQNDYDVRCPSCQGDGKVVAEPPRLLCKHGHGPECPECGRPW